MKRVIVIVVGLVIAGPWRDPAAGEELLEAEVAMVDITPLPVAGRNFRGPWAGDQCGLAFATTLVVELANAAPRYIPTSKAFAEGSYETMNSRLVPGSGEELVKVASQLLNELASRPAGE